MGDDEGILPATAPKPDAFARVTLPGLVLGFLAGFLFGLSGLAACLSHVAHAEADSRCDPVSERTSR